VPYRRRPTRRVCERWGTNSRSGPSTSSSRNATTTAISALKAGSSAPWKKIRAAMAPASSVPCAARNGANAITLLDRKPRPPTRSGCVATRSRRQRATCQRNRIQMISRKYQRKSMNWNSGRLT
jgi:hypothetical protein